MDYPQKELENPRTLGQIDEPIAETPLDTTSLDEQCPTPEEGHDLEEVTETPTEDDVVAAVVPSESDITFSAAMEAAGLGSKVRCRGWASNNAYVTDGGEALNLCFNGKNGHVRCSPYESTPADQDNPWEIIE